jgi:murein DD-endopeptidase
MIKEKCKSQIEEMFLELINKYFYSKKEIALEYIKSYIGKPYLWGGDNPMQGFDCSGLALEYLKAMGVVERNIDMTAEGIFNLFQKVDSPERGDLVFYKNKDNKIIHVEIMLNKELSIGASGGGSGTINIDDAIKQDAFVKVRNVFTRQGIAGFARIVI